MYQCTIKINEELRKKLEPIFKNPPLCRTANRFRKDYLEWYKNNVEKWKEETEKKMVEIPSESNLEWKVYSTMVGK